MKKTTTLSSILVLSTAMVVVSLNTAQAQDAPAPDKSDYAIDEIIVTAQKRSENLKDVPISMSALGAEQIAQTGIRDLKSIADYVPNLHISQSNDFRSTVSIRGVGAQSRNIGFDARVGVYVDGVYMGQSPALNQELLDLDRVEVLRGPQGTLFGKNTVAGAINLVTKKPSDEFSGEASADFGNLDYKEFKGMVNLPISDKIFTKFSVSKADRDGYIKNIITDNNLMQVDTVAYRAQVRIEATEKFQINAAFDGLNSDALILVGEPLTDSFAFAPTTLAPEERTVAFDWDPDDKRNVYGGHLDLNYETDSGYTVKSITGYRDTYAIYHNQTDYAPLDFVTIEFEDKFTQTTQEFQFISPDDQRFTYMAGIYLYDQKAQTRRDARIGKDLLQGYFATFIPGAPTAVLDGIRQALKFGEPGNSKTTNFGKVDTRSYAAYFNASYEVNERLKVGFGMRYSIEDKNVSWTSDGRTSGQPLEIPAPFVNLPGTDGNPIGTILNVDSVTDVGLYSPATAGALAPFTQLNGLAFNIGSTGPDPLNPSPLVNKRRDKFFAPAVNVMYALNDDSNVYAKYSSGYKSGGFNLDFINAAELAANAGLEFDKETVDSFEIGFKGSFFDNRFSLNMAAFIANYDNYQVNQFVDLGGGRTSIRITNAAKVRTKGIEAEAIWRASEELTFTGSLGILDAKFNQFLEGGSGGSDVSGNRLPNASKFNAAFSAQYYHELEGANAAILARIDITHRGDFFTTVNNNTTAPLRLGGTVPFDNIKALTLVNGRIGILTNNENMQFYLWGRNLTNKKQYIDDLRDFFGTIARFPNLPRTFGIEGVFKF